MTIRENVQKLVNELPGGVELVAAVKGRRIEDVVEAVAAGITVIGENYVQETELLYGILGNRVKWHFIGHLQKNKTKRAVYLFDMIETLDSTQQAREISRRCVAIDKEIPVLIEINSGRESQKHGVLPEDTERFLRGVSGLSGIKVSGLMTMGPFRENSEELRPYFAETRRVFERIKLLNLPGAEMKYLSMGMSGSYRVALEEGANIVRIGSKIFTDD